ncbi:Uncharacterised protein g8445 [Pycnogonum litorale]
MSNVALFVILVTFCVVSTGQADPYKHHSYHHKSYGYHRPINHGHYKPMKHYEYDDHPKPKYLHKIPFLIIGAILFCLPLPLLIGLAALALLGSNRTITRQIQPVIFVPGIANTFGTTPITVLARLLRNGRARNMAVTDILSRTSAVGDAVDNVSSSKR